MGRQYNLCDKPSCYSRIESKKWIALRESKYYIYDKKYAKRNKKKAVKYVTC